MIFGAIVFPFCTADLRKARHLSDLGPQVVRAPCMSLADQAPYPVISGASSPEGLPG